MNNKTGNDDNYFLTNEINEYFANNEAAIENVHGFFRNNWDDIQDLITDDQEFLNDPDLENTDILSNVPLDSPQKTLTLYNDKYVDQH